MTYLLSIDPGESTGIVLGKFTDAEPYERLLFWQVEGGLNEFIDWYFDNTFDYPYGEGGPDREFDFPGVAREFTPITVSEKFVLRSQDFVANTEPLRIEGAMVALGMDPVWQLRTCQVLAGGNSPQERRSNSDRVLKDNDLWLTGSDVGCKDANDAISATKHALYYMKNTIKHLPTLKRYFAE